MRPSRSVTAKAHPIQRLFDPPRDVGRAYLARAQTISDVTLDRKVRKDRIVLKHHTCVAMMRRQRVYAFAVEPYAARFDVGKPSDHSQQRCLATSGRPEKGEQLALFDGR